MNHGEKEFGGLTIHTPWSDNERCYLSIPEFYGRTPSENYRLDQILDWAADDKDPAKVNFALQGDPGDLGTDFRGAVTIATPNEVHLSMRLTNTSNEELKSGRHLIRLDFSQLDGLEDDTGQNTFFHTDTGWRSRADLFREAGIANIYHNVRVGSQIGKSTIIWDVIARMNAARSRMLAFSLNRAFVFSTDHPDWGRGLLTACRWHHIAPGESQTALGVLYLMNADLYALEDRYNKNRKRR